MGGKEIDRGVDLATTPLYVRAGAILPMGPIKQYDEEIVNEPMTLVVYPGADGTASLYEDDGKSFEYRQGASMRINMSWRNAARTLSLQLAPGSRMLPPARRPLNIRVAGSTKTTPIVFAGQPMTIKLS